MFVQKEVARFTGFGTFVIYLLLKIEFSGTFLSPAWDVLRSEQFNYYWFSPYFLLTAYKIIISQENKLNFRSFSHLFCLKMPFKAKKISKAYQGFTMGYGDSNPNLKIYNF